jgi:hypothetical protein
LGGFIEGDDGWTGDAVYQTVFKKVLWAEPELCGEGGDVGLVALEDHCGRGWGDHREVAVGGDPETVWRGEGECTARPALPDH